MIVVVILLLLAVEREAAAFYVDPGSGTLIWQMLLGLLLGIRFYFGRWNPFGKSKKVNKEENET